MKKVYTAFKFGTYSSSTDDVLNVTLDNDMYNETVRGSRSIIEEKVVGVESPYFFYVDDEPLEFEVNFAFEEKTKAEIKALTRILISGNTYQELSFGDIESSVYVRKTPIYNVIFVDEPQISFIGANVNGTIKYNGYFTLTARCDRPFGFEPVAEFTLTNSGTTHNAAADINVYPNISITVTGGSITNFILKSVQNSNYTGDTISQIAFSSIANGEVISINGNLFTISSDDAQSTIYSRWNRKNFELQPGNNYLVVQFTGSATVQVKLNYQAPIFIKE